MKKLITIAALIGLTGCVNTQYTYEDVDTCQERGLYSGRITHINNSRNVRLVQRHTYTNRGYLVYHREFNDCKVLYRTNW